MSAAVEGERGTAAAARAARCIACGAAVGNAASYGAVRLAACPACGSRTAVPRPSAAAAAALHDTAEYFEKQYFEARRGRSRETERRVRRLLELVAERLPAMRLHGRRLLDVGCDTGDFAAAAAQLAGAEAFGVDVAHRPLEEARARGLTVFHGDLAAAPDAFREFALVTAIDVLEHAPDPAAFLRAAAERTAADGAVYLETPNWSSLVYTIGRVAARVPRLARSAALERLFPPEHVQYFTRGGLEAVAAPAGLRPVVLFTRPLTLDAIAGSLPLRVTLRVVQLADTVLRREILLCALLVPTGEAT